MIKPWRKRSRNQVFSTLKQRLSRAERGQAIVIIGMGLLGLLAFIGLTVDVGILFIGVGHLRRAVDAAALAAASQFREGREVSDLDSIAQEVIALNDVNPQTLSLKVCLASDPSEPSYSDPHNDPGLCSTGGAWRRKLVTIEATMQVDFVFLTLIGWHNTTIIANAQSEAASVDVVLAIDTSGSMTSDASCFDGDDDDGDGSPDDCGAGSLVPGADDYNYLPVNCNAADPLGDDGFPGECHPFEEVKLAASAFIERMNFPYDRVAIVHFDLLPEILVPITDTRAVDETALLDVIKNMQVYEDTYTNPPCTFFVDSNPSGCVSTSIGGGLKLSGGEFGRAPIRQEAVWVVILLTDGAANATEPDPDDPTTNPNRYCPSSVWIQPFCRDTSWVSRHSVLDTGVVTHTNGAFYDPFNYDADDYARDMADFAACPAKKGDAAEWCTQSLDYDAIPAQGGQGALIYAIGLGQQVVAGSDGGDVDAGDRLLRYIAAAGDDGDPETDPCSAVAVPNLDPLQNDSYNCGNYFFSEFGTGLTAVFESIASRIFTRLTK
jgi:Flp pilus assembly protein TadG